MATYYVVIRETVGARKDAKGAPAVAEAVFRSPYKARAYACNRGEAYAFVLEAGCDHTPHCSWSVSEVNGPAPSWADIEHIFPEWRTPL
jgi:hypothetical protein